MVSVKIKFRSSSHGNREGVICYQIICDRKVKLITSPFRLFPYEWDKKREKVIYESADTARRNYLYSLQVSIMKEYNAFINIIGEISGKQDKVSLDDIVRLYKHSSSNHTFTLFTRLCIKELKEEGKEKTASSYATALRSFMAFRNGEDLNFDRFDARLMKHYETWLRNKNLTFNSVSFYMRILRAVYNRAVDSGLTCQNFPFKTVYTGVEKTVKRAVEEKTLVKLQALDLTDSPALSFARDMFMFSFYTRGMAFVDMAHLRKSNVTGKYLVYKRSKTQQKLIIRMEPCIENIIRQYAYMTADSDYLFPILTGGIKYRSALRLYNIRLKKISEKLKLGKPLSSYVARHSWASVAKKSNIPIQVISEGMGHDNENTTRIYLASLDQSVIDKANARLLARFSYASGRNG